MGRPSFTRRDFFKSFSLKIPTTLTDDPLFEKYSRKTLGPRVYDNRFVDYFTEGAETRNPVESSLRVGNVTSGLAEYTGAWTDKEALHLVRRTTFGFKKSHVAALTSLSMSAAVDSVLTIDNTPPAAPVNWYQSIDADAGTTAYGADWTNDAMNPTNDILAGLQQTSNYHRQDSLRWWLFGQALNQQDSIREKMVWFWYHFIPIDFEAVTQSPNAYTNQNSARVQYKYMKMMREFALGNFKLLIRQMATQPAMMFYLNNQANTATAPDENFARELMELFTLGKDPLSQYTQDDVIAAAKVLTGWRVQNLNLNTTATNFVIGSHKTGSKTFSSFFGGTVIPDGGANELDGFVDMIFSKSKVVSEYICRRLYRYFVYYDIDANVEANVIVPLALTFVANNWNIQPVLAQLFKSQHFYDMANRGVYIKSPFDILIGTMRSFNITANVSDSTNYRSQYEVWRYFADWISVPLEQRMGDVPNVSGWKAFYQSPSYHEYWINTNTIQKRFGFLQGLVSIANGFTLTYNGLSTVFKVDFIAFVQQFPAAVIADPDLLVAECIKYLLPVDITPAKQAEIKNQTLLYQQITNNYWTSAWNTYLLNGSTATIVKDRLKNLIYTIVQLAEYQLM